MIVKKVYKDAASAITDVQDGMTLMSGGFGLCGNPENLIQALHQYFDNYIVHHMHLIEFVYHLFLSTIVAAHSASATFFPSIFATPLYFQTLP